MIVIDIRAGVSVSALLSGLSVCRIFLSIIMANND